MSKDSDAAPQAPPAPHPTPFRKPRTRLSRHRLSALTLGGAVVLGLVAAAYLTTPRTSGVEGDWAANYVAGQVVGDRALVGTSGNTAIDLTTGKTVRLGSVEGGTAYIGDDRLVITGHGRLDSVRLDATARWTWQAPAGSTVRPVAAGHGSTVVTVCPATGPCDLLGLDARGREGWRAKAVGRRDASEGQRALPAVAATPVSGGGYLLTDPATGRRSLRPGRAVLDTDSGTVVIADVQAGTCVVSAYTSPDPAWTRVLQRCPGGTVPGLAAANGSLALSWPGTVERLALATGQTTTAPTPRPGQLAAAGPLVAVRTQRSTPLNPLRWGRTTRVLTLVDTRTGDTRAQLATTERLDLLRLEPDALVVRQGDRVVRYTLT